MKIYSIKNDYIKEDLGYLLYYEKEKEFYIEINDKLNTNNLPFIFEYFINRKEYTINSYWSYIWVKERIVPKERQNIVEILRENNLEEYDEFKLLIISKGRCAQDDDYIEELKKIPSLVLERNKNKISEVIPLKNHKIIVMFNNGLIRKYDLEKIIENKHELNILMNDIKYYSSVKIKASGYEISWGENIFLTSASLLNKGTEVPLNKDEMQQIMSSIIINTQEACEILDCSRQNIDDLVRREKLLPIKESSKSKLFLKGDIIKRKW